MSSGGQDNEIGSEYRARLGALLATSVLLASDVRHVGAPFWGIPLTIRAEADTAVDDLVVLFGDGRRAYIQAKHAVQLSRSVTSPFGKAIAQFVEAHRLEQSDEPLVLAYSRGSEPLSDFGRWCEALRFAEPGIPSRKQEAAAERFGKLLCSLGWDGGDKTGLAKRIYLWNVEPRHGDGYGAATQRLMQAGVKAEDCSDAFDCLANRIRHLAQRRAGDDGNALVDVLRRAGRIQLEDHQAPSVRAAMLVSEYRERLVRQGRSLSVYGVPAAVANVPLSEGDADVRVQLLRKADENSSREMALGRALRRRGRVVLLGTGGSGKSTALRVLAAQLAAEQDGPLPLKAHWQDVWRHRDDPLAGLARDAVRDLGPADRALLDTELRRAFRAGETVLLLDGLDEIALGREKAAADVKQWLDSAPATTEVVVASRPSASRAIDIFDWPHLTLAEPKDGAATARALISALAKQADNGEEWIEERLAWVRDQWARDRHLGSTPLVVVLLGTLAGTAPDVDQLPRTRTAVLIDVLRAVVKSWEVGTRLDGRVQICDLGATQADAVVQRALYVFARAAVIGDVDVRAELEEDLQTFMGPIAKGRARACVEDAERFWLATGIFSFADTTVRAHPRPLAEAALAWQAIDESTPTEGVMQFRAERSGWEVLALLALEGHEVMGAWAEQASRDGSADELIALIDAHGDGAALTNDQVAGLVARAAEVGVDDLRDLDRMVEAILVLNASPELVMQFRGALQERVALRDHSVVEAALLARVGEISEDDLEWLRAFYCEVRPESGRDEKGNLVVRSLDNFHLQTLQEIALYLVTRSPADGQLVLSRLDGLRTRGFSARLRKACLEVGYDEMAERAAEASVVEPLDWSGWGDYKEATETALTFASHLGDRRALSLVESRRLDELADLWASMHAEWWSPQWVERSPQILDEFMRIAVALGGFDAAALAAGARQILRELVDEPETDEILRDSATQRRFSRWDQIADCESMVDSIIHVFPRVPYQCLPPLMDALDAAPSRPYVHQRVLAELPKLRKIWKLQAALVGLSTATDPVDLAVAWAADNDVRLRQTAATALTYLLEVDAPAGETAAIALLDDLDRGVQVETVHAIAAARGKGLPISPSILRQLALLEHQPGRPYVCLWCDTQVSAGRQACVSCESGGPSFDGDLDRALQRTRPSKADVVLQRIRDHAPRRRVRSAIHLFV